MMPFRPAYRTGRPSGVMLPNSHQTPSAFSSAALLFQGAQSGEAGDEFALVVAGAAPVQAAVPFGQGEGRRVPEFGGVLGLHVVVVVDQQREGPLAGLCQEDRGHLSGVLADGEALGFQQGLHSPGGVWEVAALGGDAGDGDEVGEVTQAALNVGREVGWGHPWQRTAIRRGMPAPSGRVN